MRNTFAAKAALQRFAKAGERLKGPLGCKPGFRVVRSSDTDALANPASSGMRFTIHYSNA
jgi:hypothetical protein